MLYFVHHGETDWNCEPVRCQGWADVPLNDAGRRRAREQGSRPRSGSIRLLRAFLDGAGVEALRQTKVPSSDLLEVPCEGLVARVDSFLAAQSHTTPTSDPE